MPVSSRATAGAADVAQRHRAPGARGRAAALRRRPRAPRVGRGASTSVFHSPQPAQRPDQVSVSWPQG